MGDVFKQRNERLNIFFSNFLTSAAIDFQLSVRCVRNYDYFQFISRLFPCDINNLWEFNFCGWRQFALCRKKNHASLCMTDSFISETSAWGRMLYWKDREEWRNEGRKEIFWIFIISFFHYLYSSTQRRYRADRRLVDRCVEEVRKQRMRSGYLQLTFAMFYWRQIFHENVVLRIDKYPENQSKYAVLSQCLLFSLSTEVYFLKY